MHKKGTRPPYQKHQKIPIARFHFQPWLSKYNQSFYRSPAPLNIPARLSFPVNLD